MYKTLMNTSRDSNEYQHIKLQLAIYNTNLKKIIRLAKKSYYHDILQKSQSDIKQTWTNINKIINRNTIKKEIAPTLFLNGTHINNEHVIADTFNDYFANI